MPVSSRGTFGAREDSRQPKLFDEQARKERLALVKKLTRGESSDEEDEEGLVEEEPEIDSETLTTEQDIKRLLGFAGFDTTKGKQVADNKKGSAVGAVSKHKKRKYRQYMNRRGEEFLYISIQ